MHPSRLLVTIALLLSLVGCIESIQFTPWEEEPPPPVLAPSEPVLRFPPNNSYRGSVHAGPLRPTFQWEASTWAGPELVLYELELSTDPTFASGVTIVKTSGTSHQPVSNLPVSSVPPVGARYFWRVRACVADACSQPSSTWWVNVGRTERDLNGDGLADAVVVSGGAASATATAGRLFVYLGGRGSFDTQADSVFAGSGDVWFRSAVAIGDFNGDGFSDLAAKVANQLNQGLVKIHIYTGGAGSVLDATPDYIFAAGDCAALGDVNRDGFDDLWMPGNIVLGHPIEPLSATLNLSGPVRGAGDVNGDGYADLVSSYDQVLLHYGSELPLDSVPDGALPKGAEDTFGNTVSSGGDINGDGFADLLVGAYGEETGGLGAGRAYAFFGGPGLVFDSAPDGVMDGMLDDLLGISVGAAGDLNGDGFDDVGIRMLRNGFVGGLRVYFGSPGTTMSSSYTQLLGTETSKYFGRYFAAADVNGDGFDDLVSGALGYQPNPTTDFVGAAYVYFGAAGPVLDPIPDAMMTGISSRDAFGYVAMDNAQFLLF